MANKKFLKEEELIALLKQKDGSTFSYLYDNYSDALHGVIYRILNDDATAEDVLQDTFVKVWKNMDSYDPSKGRLYTWLLNIARNLAIDKYRSTDFKKQSQNQRIDDDVHVLNIKASASKVDHIGLKETVSTLRPEYIQLIDLLYFKGYTHDEVAKEFNIPLGTVKTRIRAAIIQLREKLDVNYKRNI